MAFLKTFNFFSNSRLLPTRLPQLSQISGIKKKTSLKDLNIPDKPKRPLTPYFRFVQDHRDSVLKEYPNWKLTQISVQCASDWRNLDKTTKQKYEQDFKSEMEQYAKKYSQYLSNLTDEQKEVLEALKKEAKVSKLKREKRKKLKEHEKPKRPIGAYMLYVQEQAKNYPSKSYVQLLSDLKDPWAAMPAGEKAKYSQAAARAKEQYDKDLKTWELRMIEEGNTDIVRQATLLSKSKK